LLKYYFFLPLLYVKDEYSFTHQLEGLDNLALKFVK
jgi:hypothetical protein